VSTASGAHMQGKIGHDNLEDIVRRDKGYAGFEVYGSTKLANILFTRELGRRLEGTGVVASCFHPGFVATRFGHDNKGAMGTIIKIGQAIFARTPEKGAETLIWLATSPEAADPHGDYFMDMKVARRSKRAQDDALARRLWDLTEGLLTQKAA
jgi:NAD(P)-dependent dehydrogenase (short-subunit alcohol dehydrogenase family)